MTQIDPKLLNKLRAIKALRDRAGTDGERDAAQHKLTIIMAKHKLTEQDVPSDSFSTRGRGTTSQKMSDFRDFQRAAQDQQFFWDNLEKRFAEHARKAQEADEREHKARQKRPPQDNPKVPPRFDPIGIITGAKVRWRGWLLVCIGDALGYKHSVERRLEDDSLMWMVYPSPRIVTGLYATTVYPHFGDILPFFENLTTQLKTLCVEAKRQLNPANPNAFDRAFYEEATFIVRERLAKANGLPPMNHHPKARNPLGFKAGNEAGQLIDLYPIT